MSERMLSDSYDALEEAGFIADLSQWPRWPVLPVKYRGTDHDEKPGDHTCGIVLATAPHTVILVNLWDLQNGDLRPQIAGKETIEFDSIEEMVRAGWIGD